jgi:hypothetical protein
MRLQQLTECWTIATMQLSCPKQLSGSLVLSEGIAGKRLAEGDAPARFTISQEGLEEYGKDWRKIRAAVYDSAGREYMSKEPSKNQPPSWATPTKEAAK